jgi:hypothetical protein
LDTPIPPSSDSNTLTFCGNIIKTTVKQQGFSICDAEGAFNEKGLEYLRRNLEQQSTLHVRKSKGFTDLNDGLDVITLKWTYASGIPPSFSPFYIYRLVVTKMSVHSDKPRYSAVVNPSGSAANKQMPSTAGVGGKTNSSTTPSSSTHNNTFKTNAVKRAWYEVIRIDAMVRKHDVVTNYLWFNALCNAYCENGVNSDDIDNVVKPNQIKKAIAQLPTKILTLSALGTEHTIHNNIVKTVHGITRTFLQTTYDFANNAFATVDSNQNFISGCSSDIDLVAFARLAGLFPKHQLEYAAIHCGGILLRQLNELTLSSRTCWKVMCLELLTTDCDGLANAFASVTDIVKLQTFYKLYHLNESSIPNITVLNLYIKIARSIRYGNAYGVHMFVLEEQDAGKEGTTNIKNKKKKKKDADDTLPLQQNSKTIAFEDYKRVITDDIVTITKDGDYYTNSDNSHFELRSGFAVCMWPKIMFDEETYVINTWCRLITNYSHSNKTPRSTETKYHSRLLQALEGRNPVVFVEECDHVEIFSFVINTYLRSRKIATPSDIIEFNLMYENIGDRVVEDDFGCVLVITSRQDLHTIAVRQLAWPVFILSALITPTVSHSDSLPSIVQALRSLNEIAKTKTTIIFMNSETFCPHQIAEFMKLCEIANDVTHSIQMLFFGDALALGPHKPCGTALFNTITTLPAFAQVCYTLETADENVISEAINMAAASDSNEAILDSSDSYYFTGLKVLRHLRLGASLKNASIASNAGYGKIAPLMTHKRVTELDILKLIKAPTGMLQAVAKNAVSFVACCTSIYKKQYVILTSNYRTVGAVNKMMTTSLMTSLTTHTSAELAKRKMMQSQTQSDSTVGSILKMEDPPQLLLRENGVLGIIENCNRSAQLFAASINGAALIDNSVAVDPTLVCNIKDVLEMAEALNNAFKKTRNDRKNPFAFVPIRYNALFTVKNFECLMIASPLDVRASKTTESPFTVLRVTKKTEKGYVFPLQSLVSTGYPRCALIFSTCPTTATTTINSTADTDDLVDVGSNMNSINNTATNILDVYRVVHMTYVSNLLGRQSAYKYPLELKARKDKNRSENLRMAPAILVCGESGLMPVINDIVCHVDKSLVGSLLRFLRLPSKIPTNITDLDCNLLATTIHMITKERLTNQPKDSTHIDSTVIHDNSNDVEDEKEIEKEDEEQQQQQMGDENEDTHTTLYSTSITRDFDEI